MGKGKRDATLLFTLPLKIEDIKHCPPVAREKDAESVNTQRVRVVRGSKVCSPDTFMFLSLQTRRR